jgi:bifunctional non-homologous end joining protein LigD
VSRELRVGRRKVAITHPDRILFPRARVTKHELAGYYQDVAPAMLPHVRGRPVAMQSFPAGVERPGYYVKNAPKHFPGWIERARVRKRGGSVNHVLANDAATLVYLAGQNCVTPHVWLSRADDIHTPDRLVFDLDPSGERFAEVRAAARALGDLVRDAGLEPFAMTTGSRGIHVTVPLRRSASFERVRRFAQELAQALVDADPRRLTLEHRKKRRGERIFVDILRNAYAQHAVPPYAVRPRPDAPVAMPLRWEELSERTLKPRRWTVASAPARLRSEGDAWRGIGRRARSLPRAAG